MSNTSSPLAIAKADIQSQLESLQVKLDEVESRANDLRSEKSELEGQLERLMSAFPNLEGAPSSPPASKPSKAETKRPRKTRTRAGGNGKTTAMVDSMKQVMGGQTMSSAEVAAALTSEGLAPESKNLVAYVSSVFSAAVDVEGEKVFTRESRGRYRVSAADRDDVVETTEASSGSAKEATVEIGSDEAARQAERLLNEVGLDSASLGISPLA